VARQERIHDLRDYGVFVSLHSGEERLPAFDGAEKIRTDFVLYGTRRGSRVKIRNAAQLAEGGGLPASCGRVLR
jgi:hypothetical protein